MTLLFSLFTLHYRNVNIKYNFFAISKQNLILGDKVFLFIFHSTHFCYIQRLLNKPAISRALSFGSFWCCWLRLFLCVSAKQWPKNLVSFSGFYCSAAVQMETLLFHWKCKFFLGVFFFCTFFYKKMSTKNCKQTIRYKFLLQPENKRKATEDFRRP